MKLTDLEPQFHRYERRREMRRMLKPGIDPLRGNWTDDDIEVRETETLYHVDVDSLAEAQAVMFLCPLCFQKNGGAVGTHSIDVTFSDRGVSDSDGTHTLQGAPVRWKVGGTGYADLTTQPSILLTGSGCGWHGFITNGQITFC